MTVLFVSYRSAMFIVGAGTGFIDVARRIVVDWDGSFDFGQYTADRFAHMVLGRDQFSHVAVLHHDVAKEAIIPFPIGPKIDWFDRRVPEPAEGDVSPVIALEARVEFVVRRPGSCRVHLDERTLRRSQER